MQPQETQIDERKSHTQEQEAHADAVAITPAGGGRGLCAAGERSERAGAGLLIKVATSGTFQLLAGGGKERAA